MRARLIDIGLLAIAAAVCAGAYRRVDVAPVSVTAMRSSSVTVPVTSSDTLDSAEARVLARDVFGIEQGVADVASAPQVPSNATIAIPPGVFTARISVQAIAGPPWIAVLSGLPGRTTQTVVLAGDTVGVYRIRSISRDSVTIQAPDSLIRLSLIRVGY